MNKLVSVVVPNYNCAEYLDKCLEHIVNQTYTNFECIVCDNASTDNSLEIINRWAEKDSRIKVLTTEVNQGGLKCYNRMFWEAKGEYIMIQDSDDWCDLQRIEKQVAILDKYNVGCCMTNSIFYYSHIEPEYPAQPGSGIVNMEQEDWAPATIMFKRAILKTIPGYHLYWDRVTSYDNYFILSIISEYGGYYTDEYLYFVWARPNSDHRTIDLSEPNARRKLISFDIYKELKKQRIATGTDWLKDNDMNALKTYEQKLLNDKNCIADKLRMFACIQIDNDKFETGWALLKQAIGTAPTFIKNYQSVLYFLKAKLKRAK